MSYERATTLGCAILGIVIWLPLPEYSAQAQSPDVSSSAPAISNDDPAMTRIRQEGERLLRCRAAAQAFNFSTASSTVIPSANVTFSTSPNIDSYLPPAKLGNGNYFYAASGVNSWNVFALAAVSEIPGGGGFGGDVISAPGLTVSQAYSIDRKIDDGLPQSGNVLAVYMKTGGFWWSSGPSFQGTPYVYEVQGTSTTCFDNGGVSQATQQYSVEVSNGANVTCALTFKMQAGD